MQRKDLGLAIIGSGRIGTLRAVLASRHAAVKFLAVSDQDPKRAEALAKKTGAQLHTGDNLAAMMHPEVNAIVISTIELQHTEPVLQALATGKPVLLEKPLAVDIATADRIIAAAEKSGSSLHIGYSRRFKKRYLLAKEQIVQGRLGTITGTAARVYNSRSQAMQTLARMKPENNPVSGLTYYIDLMNWLLAGNEPVEVVARGQKGALKAMGQNSVDVAWVLITYADGAVASMGVSYALPRLYPAMGHAARVEVLGTEGVMLLDDDHTDRILYSEQGADHVYIPEHRAKMSFIGSGTPGDWALGEFHGPVATETRAWLDYLAMGTTCHLSTAHDARKVVAMTVAIEESLRTRRAVEL